MAIGIYGGNFDPIHIGHLITAQYVLEQRNLNKIVFIPANISPLKQDVHTESGTHRFEMVKLATERNEKFEVSDTELRREGISFTRDTLKEFKENYGEIELIIGYDNLVKFDKWKYPQEILNLCRLIVLHRKVDKEPDDKNIFFDQAIIVDSPTLEISSTEIRDRVKKGLPIDYLVPLKVKEYIYKNSLYK